MSHHITQGGITKKSTNHPIPWLFIVPEGARKTTRYNTIKNNRKKSITWSMFTKFFITLMRATRQLMTFILFKFYFVLTAHINTTKHYSTKQINVIKLNYKRIKWQVVDSKAMIRLYHLRPQTRKKISRHCIIEWAISIGISVIFIASAKFNCRFKMSQSNMAMIDWTPKPIQYGCLNLGWKCNKTVYLLF